MTYQDDPNINRRPTRDARSNTGLWLAAAAALMLIVGLFAWGSSDRSDVARTDRPAATTTGSGDRATAPAPAPRPSAIPSNPSGTAPQKDSNQPAPQPR